MAGLFPSTFPPIHHSLTICIFDGIKSELLTELLKDSKINKFKMIRSDQPLGLLLSQFTPEAHKTSRLRVYKT